MRNKFKTESIEEFIARGGSVKKIPTNISSKIDTVNKTTNGGPVTILSLEDADLYYGDNKPTKSSSSKKSKLDLSALPEHLRNRFINKLRNEDNDGEEETD